MTNVATNESNEVGFIGTLALPVIFLYGGSSTSTSTSSNGKSNEDEKKKK